MTVRRRGSWLATRRARCRAMWRLVGFMLGVRVSCSSSCWAWSLRICCSLSSLRLCLHSIATLAQCTQGYWQYVPLPVKGTVGKVGWAHGDIVLAAYFAGPTAAELGLPGKQVAGGAAQGMSKCRDGRAAGAVLQGLLITWPPLLGQLLPTHQQILQQHLTPHLSCGT